MTISFCGCGLHGSKTILTNIDRFNYDKCASFEPFEEQFFCLS